MQIGMSIQREERVIFVDISRIEAGIMLNMQFKKVYVFTNADIKKEGVIKDHFGRERFFISASREYAVYARGKRLLTQPCSSAEMY